MKILLLISLFLVGIGGHLRAQMSQHSIDIKAQAQRFRPGDKLSIRTVNGEEQFGKFKTSDDVTLTYFDIDKKLDQQLPFDDIARVKKGYGGYNPPTHKHVDRTKERIAIAAIVCGLALIVIAAAKAQ